MSNKWATDHFVFEELEKRILFSADIGVLAPALPGTDVIALELPQYQSPILPTDLKAGTSAASTDQENRPRHEAVFIDGAVEGAHELADQLVAQQDPARILDVYVLDPSKDGVAQISEFLATQQNLDGIHIISHGADGSLQLGSTRLDSASLRGNALAISGWGAALATEGDILLYGCDVAQTAAGQQFVDTIGKLTGADIAASNDLTGNSKLGGDWTLEYSTGKIETQLAPDRAIQCSYSGVLATYTVTSNADSGAGTLREAITLANAHAGADTINFNIGSGLQTINLLTQLDDVIDVTTIDATTQPGRVGNVPAIELNGSSSSTIIDGLLFTDAGSAGSSVKGLVINGFSDGIVLTRTSNITIQGNYIGTDATGTMALANNDHGIALDHASNNVIGGTSAAARNIISGNAHNGIDIEDSVSTGNAIMGNYIGVDVTGSAALGNGRSGILLNLSGGNTIGGTSAGYRNVISGNGHSGIDLIDANGNTVAGNYIGIDAAGMAALGNTNEGVTIDGSSASNTIGGSTAAARNIISGNAKDGVILYSSANNNNLYGNYIGLNAAGNGVLNNNASGIKLLGSNNNIGSTTAGTTNVISGNAQYGIVLNGGTNNQIKNNYIGVGADGVTAFGNGGDGIRLAANSDDNSIGGFNVGEGNIIANSGGDGVNILVGGGTNNVICVNSIYNNAGLGIDLNNDGVTPNDSMDTDTGANTLQNYPVISVILPSGASTTVGGTFNSTANTDFRLEFYSNTVRDGSNNGEGQTFIGYIDITTDASGNATFGASFTTGTAELWISGTATNMSSFNTSEFAASIHRNATVTNSAPQGANNNVTALEDTPYTFTAGQFGFHDPGDSPANNFVAVVITTVPASGTLMLNNAALSAGAVVSKADIDAGLLTYLGAANANGTAAASYTFQVRDDGANNTTDTTPRSMTINILSVNDAPAGADHSLTILENASYTFGVSDFALTDPNDSPANSLNAVYVDTLPGQGNLFLGGTAIASGALVSASAIAAGQLVFVPLAQSTAAVSFTFRVQDNGGTSNGGVNTAAADNTTTINFTPVNSAPVLATSSGTTAYTEGQPGVAIDGQLTVSDADNLTLASARIVLSGGSFRAGDVLGFSNTDATAMGNIAGTYDPQNGLLVLSSAGSTATVAQWQAALRAVTYASSSQNPDTVNRTISFTVNDGALDSAVASKTLAVTAVNNAPVVNPSGGAASFTEGSTAQVIDAGLTLADVDNATLASARVSIASGFAGAQDQLGFSNTGAAAMGNIAASFNAATGVLTLTSSGATATLAQWQTALRAVTYSNSSTSPDTASRGISFTVNDGSLDSAAGSKNLTVVALNSAPTGTPGSVSVADNGAHTFVAADFGFSDAADVAPGHPGNRFLSVLITSLPAPGSGVLTLNGAALQAGSSVLVADIDAGRLVYTPAALKSGALSTSFGFSVRDDGGVANGGQDTDTAIRQMRLLVTHVAGALPPAIVVPVRDDPGAAPVTTAPVADLPGAVANPSLIVVDLGTSTQATQLDNPNAVDGGGVASEADRAASSTRAAAAASAAAAAANDAAHRVDIPVTAGARQLAIEVDTSVIRANVARFLADKADNSLPAITEVATRAAASAPDSGSLFKVDVVVQAPERRNNLLVVQKISSSDSAISTAPAQSGSSSEENRKEYSALRATAHRIEAAFAVSALGTVWIVARKAALVASLMSTVPAWMRIDPLPILAGDEEPKEELEEEADSGGPGDSVEHLFSVEAQSDEPGKEAG